MNKMQMAHEMALAMAADGNVPNENIVAIVWQYADAMQDEADKRNKAEAEQKRKEIREMLNAPNTFVEREGQHFDDVEEWQPDWSQAPKWANWWAADSDGCCYFFANKPIIGNAIWMPTGSRITGKASSFGFTGNWQDSLRERPHGL